MPAHIRILKQGSLPRGKLLGEFRADTHSILVGTTSFWQGVDVPGESLSCVVIMKLPFSVPDEPMVQARVETIRERGQDAFLGYSVPQAVMMFRQGFGRLIRTASDRGVVAILDPRVVTKPYGKTFFGIAAALQTNRRIGTNQFVCDRDLNVSAPGPHPNTALAPPGDHPITGEGATPRRVVISRAGLDRFKAVL